MNKSNVRIIFGLIAIPAFLLISNSIALAAITLLFIIAAKLNGRKIRYLLIVMVLITIPLINLLQTNGKILFSIGSFPITAGALELGMEKALTLIGMIYISQFMVSGKPSFPGKFGQLLSRQFIYFEHLVSSWKRPEKRKFIQSLDTLLFSMEAVAVVDVKKDTAGGKSSVSGTKETSSSLKKEIFQGAVLAAAAWGMYVVLIFV